MLAVQKFPEYDLISKKCELLLQDKKIRFAGVIDKMGNLVAGGFKKGIIPLEDDAERRKMYMELALRVLMRRDFDHSLGPVLYSASRRKNAVMISFPLETGILLISAEVNIDIESFAKKVMKIVHRT